MGLKGVRLWVIGQLDSTFRAPPQGAELAALLDDGVKRGQRVHQLLVRLRLGARLPLLLGVAPQVAYLKGKL
jgi:hypothetical protein